MWNPVICAYEYDKICKHLYNCKNYATGKLFTSDNKTLINITINTSSPKYIYFLLLLLLNTIIVIYKYCIMIKLTFVKGQTLIKLWIYINVRSVITNTFLYKFQF